MNSNSNSNNSNNSSSSSRSVSNQLDVLDYRVNMLHRDVCVMKSREALKKKKDVDMFKFWANASRAFEHRALDDNNEERMERLKREVREVKNV